MISNDITGIIYETFSIELENNGNNSMNNSLSTKGGQGKGRALGSGEVKFAGQVLPTAKKITYFIDLKRVIMRKLVMGIADATMQVDGKVIYQAKDLKVGLFVTTDNF